MSGWDHGRRSIVRIHGTVSGKTAGSVRTPWAPYSVMFSRDGTRLAIAHGDEVTIWGSPRDLDVRQR